MLAAGCTSTRMSRAPAGGADDTLGAAWPARSSTLAWPAGDAAPGRLAAVNAAWSEFVAAKGIVPIRHSTTRNATMITWQSVFSGRAADVTALEDRLARAGVKKIETRQIASPEE